MMRSGGWTKKTRAGALVLTAVLAVLASSCGKKEVRETPPVVQPAKTFVVGGAAGASLTYPGRVDASERVDLTFRVSGPLIEFPIEKGQEVEKGQMLARIDPRDYQIRMQEARAQFVKAEADFNRYQTLYEKEAVSIAELDLARSQRDVAKAKLEDAGANLGDTYLKAPFAGIVADTYVDNFQEVSKNQRILSLIDVQSIDIVVDLPEFTIARANKASGVKLTATFDVAPGRRFPLEFKEIAAQADPATQTYAVTLTMPQPEGVNILPGMTAQVRAIIEGDMGQTTKAIRIPSVAVFEGDSGERMVWVVDESDMTVHTRKVGVGEVTGEDRIYITDGLSLGDRVVVAGVHKLREGMKIRLMDQ